MNDDVVERASNLARTMLSGLSESEADVVADTLRELVASLLEARKESAAITGVLKKHCGDQEEDGTWSLPLEDGAYEDYDAAGTIDALFVLRFV